MLQLCETRVTRSLSATQIGDPAVAGAVNAPLQSAPIGGGVLTSTRMRTSISVQQYTNTVGAPVYGKHVQTSRTVTLAPPPTNVDSDSDSDGPILYRYPPSVHAHTHDVLFRDEPSTSTSRVKHGDEDDDNDEVVASTSLAARVQRKDTLSLRRALDDMPPDAAGRRLADMRHISVRLERKLSQRPTVEELADKNILRGVCVRAHKFVPVHVRVCRTKHVGGGANGRTTKDAHAQIVLQADHTRAAGEADNRFQ